MRKKLQVYITVCYNKDGTCYVDKVYTSRAGAYQRAYKLESDLSPDYPELDSVAIIKKSVGGAEHFHTSRITKKQMFDIHV